MSILYYFKVPLCCSAAFDLALTLQLLAFGMINNEVKDRNSAGKKIHAFLLQGLDYMLSLLCVLTPVSG